MTIFSNVYNKDVSVKDGVPLEKLMLKKDETVCIDSQGSVFRLLQYLFYFNGIDIPQAALSNLKYLYFDKSLQQRQLDEFMANLSCQKTGAGRFVINDLLANNAGNDVLSFLSLERLSKISVNYEILFSHNTFVFLEAYQHKFSALTDSENIAASLSYVATYAKNGFSIKWSRVDFSSPEQTIHSYLLDQTQKNYFSKLKLFSFDVDARNLFIYCNFPVNSQIIKSLAQEFEVNYRDQTPKELSETLTRINAAVIKIFEQGIQQKINFLFSIFSSKGNQPETEKFSNFNVSYKSFEILDAPSKKNEPLLLQNKSIVTQNKPSKMENSPGENYSASENFSGENYQTDDRRDYDNSKKVGVSAHNEEELNHICALFITHEMSRLKVSPVTIETDATLQAAHLIVPARISKQELKILEDIYDNIGDIFKYESQDKHKEIRSGVMSLITYVDFANDITEQQLKQLQHENGVVYHFEYYNTVEKAQIYARTLVRSFLKYYQKMLLKDEQEGSFPIWKKQYLAHLAEKCFDARIDGAFTWAERIEKKILFTDLILIYSEECESKKKHVSFALSNFSSEELKTLKAFTKNKWEEQKGYQEILFNKIQNLNENESLYQCEQFTPDETEFLRVLLDKNNHKAISDKLQNYKKKPINYYEIFQHAIENHEGESFFDDNSEIVIDVENFYTDLKRAEPYEFENIKDFWDYLKSNRAILEKSIWIFFYEFINITEDFLEKMPQADIEIMLEICWENFSRNEKHREKFIETAVQSKYPKTKELILRGAPTKDSNKLKKWLEKNIFVSCVWEKSPEIFSEITFSEVVQSQCDNKLLLQALRYPAEIEAIKKVYALIQLNINEEEVKLLFYQLVENQKNPEVIKLFYEIFCGHPSFVIFLKSHNNFLDLVKKSCDAYSQENLTYFLLSIAEKMPDVLLDQLRNNTVLVSLFAKYQEPKNFRDLINFLYAHNSKETSDLLANVNISELLKSAVSFHKYPGVLCELADTLTKVNPDVIALNITTAFINEIMVLATTEAAHQDVCNFVLMFLDAKNHNLLGHILDTRVNDLNFLMFMAQIGNLRHLKAVSEKFLEKFPQKFQAQVGEVTKNNSNIFLIIAQLELFTHHISSYFLKDAAPDISILDFLLVLEGQESKLPAVKEALCRADINGMNMLMHLTKNVTQKNDLGEIIEFVASDFPEASKSLFTQCNTKGEDLLCLVIQEKLPEGTLSAFAKVLSESKHRPILTAIIKKQTNRQLNILKLALTSKVNAKDFYALFSVLNQYEPVIFLAMVKELLESDSSKADFFNCIFQLETKKIHELLELSQKISIEHARDLILMLIRSKNFFNTHVGCIGKWLVQFYTDHTEIVKAILPILNNDQIYDVLIAATSSADNQSITDLQLQLITIFRDNNRNIFQLYKAEDFRFRVDIPAEEFTNRVAQLVMLEHKITEQQYFSNQTKYFYDIQNIVSSGLRDQMQDEAQQRPEHLAEVKKRMHDKFFNYFFIKLCLSNPSIIIPLLKMYTKQDPQLPESVVNVLIETAVRALEEEDIAEVKNHLREFIDNEVITKIFYSNKILAIAFERKLFDLFDKCYSLFPSTSKSDDEKIDFYAAIMRKGHILNYPRFFNEVIKKVEQNVDEMAKIFFSAATKADFLNEIINADGYPLEDVRKVITLFIAKSQAISYPNLMKSFVERLNDSNYENSLAILKFILNLSKENSQYIVFSVLSAALDKKTPDNFARKLIDYLKENKVCEEYAQVDAEECLKTIAMLNRLVSKDCITQPQSFTLLSLVFKKESPENSETIKSIISGYFKVTCEEKSPDNFCYEFIRSLLNSNKFKVHVIECLQEKTYGLYTLVYEARITNEQLLNVIDLLKQGPNKNQKIFNTIIKPILKKLFEKSWISSFSYDLAKFLLESEAFKAMALRVLYKNNWLAKPIILDANNIKSSLFACIDLLIKQKPTTEPEKELIEGIFLRETLVYEPNELDYPADSFPAISVLKSLAEKYDGGKKLVALHKLDWVTPEFKKEIEYLKKTYQESYPDSAEQKEYQSYINEVRANPQKKLLALQEKLLTAEAKIKVLEAENQKLRAENQRVHAENQRLLQESKQLTNGKKHPYTQSDSNSYTFLGEKQANSGSIGNVTHTSSLDNTEAISHWVKHSMV